MRVHRLIFRLDFQKPNFDIVNSPGAVMQILSDMGDQYWPAFQDDSANRRVSATNIIKEKGIFRQISVEPINLNFAFESVAGVDINSLDMDDTFSTLFKGVRAICGKFGIQEIQRAGIRFFILSNIQQGNFRLSPSFKGLLDPQLVEKVNTTLGEIRDIGLSFDGESSDKLSYHCRFGPYEANEAQKYFPGTTSNIFEENKVNANFIFDLDLFEEKFVMTVNADKWSKGPIQKAQELVKEIEKYLSERS